MKLSLTIQTPEVEKTLPVALLRGSLEEKLQKASRLGADGVEIATTNPASLDSQALCGSLERYNLKAAAIASGGMAFSAGLTLLNPQEEISALAQQRLRDLIDFAAAVKAPIVTIGSFRGRVAPFGPAGRSRLKNILCEAGNHAVGKGVHLAIEPLNRFETDIIFNVDEGLAFLQEAGHPALGLLLDTFHVNIEESSWSAPFLRAAKAGKLLHVHLGDNNRLPPGQGLIDFRSILSALQSAGYDGFLSAELLARPDPDSAAQATLSYIRPLLPG